jgi:hypothetical protein
MIFELLHSVGFMLHEVLAKVREDWGRRSGNIKVLP